MPQQVCIIRSTNVTESKIEFIGYFNVLILQAHYSHLKKI